LGFNTLGQKEMISPEYQRFRWGDQVLACSNGPLVYVRTLKCASSFFYNNLTETFKWRTMHWQDIDWYGQRVFGHVMDPVERRHKGVLEYLIMTNTTHLLEDKNFLAFIKHIPHLDEHTTSYHELYGDFLERIDWIPLGRDHSKNIELTQTLMSQYGQVLFPWDYSHARPASENMLIWYQQLRDLWESDPWWPPTTITYLRRDIEFWTRLCEKFNSAGTTWDEISWLR
jgi:hypothetical protein